MLNISFRGKYPAQFYADDIVNGKRSKRGRLKGVMPVLVEERGRRVPYISHWQGSVKEEVIYRCLMKI